MAIRVPTFSLGRRRDPARRGAWDLGVHPFTTRARRERPTLTWCDTLTRIASKSLLLAILRRMKSWCIRTFRSSGVSALQISTRLFLTKNKHKMYTAPCNRLIVLEVQICTVTCSCCLVRIFFFLVVYDRNATRGLGVGVPTSISSHNGFSISRELVL